MNRANHVKGYSSAVSQFYRSFIIVYESNSTGNGLIRAARLVAIGQKKVCKSEAILED